ncbi:CYTH and CHAD domain-containing protein [Acinetobacter bereziniae]|uniref:CYTH and CHAD domain-containing protein n=1 Tax=Acinetobacter bereziniae TaxID=106648 RepID=UPI000EF65C40|nr:CYTH and CHAD domain-containing protein [Acinetobacter bereziniae]MBJ8423358.1 CYTH and CHAD domain-containing protein [Acinetobacter bereziniae]MCU4475499.1 CYTH and CHAD domain-containing protein [Acinetobacter bereziniae]MCU4542435.1 CYTH and CHAD domain-containing protein [Acinetobacter bereziniae]MCU4626569.1 CYTH and CHAD domain-containing protein [Acinetobacter bereziniae]MDR6539840.1 inorganic triphosphatase YgiF [Acinetobacter bereziniae]
MFEIELKFQIPQEKQDALIKAFQRKNDRSLHLQAKYYDTPSFILSEHSISLRQRLENDQWVQTLKLPTEQKLKRAEFEHVLATDETELDLEVYLKNKQIDKSIQTLLEQNKSLLEIQFQTDIERRLSVFHFQNSQIEVSYDQGQIFTQDDRLTLHELEFELKQGTVQDLISFILPRVKRYGLWLDVRSKAQQGFQLAQSIQDNPVEFQTSLQLDAKDTAEIVLKKMFNNCLNHLLPNSTAIASGNFNSNHVHQARVAIRRLRSAIKTFSGWSLHIDPTWQMQLTELFRQLGSTRDLDVIREELLPQLEAVGAPKFKLPESETTDRQKLTKLFRSFNFNYLILSLIQFIEQDSTEKTKTSAHKLALKKISKLHQKIQLDAQNYLNLDIEARHKTRKNLKRLRYSLEFVSSLCDKKAVKKYLKSIKPAQESLGLYNDFIVAEELLTKLVNTQPQVWFALGWIASEKQRVLQQSQQDLLDFAQISTLQ